MWHSQWCRQRGGNVGDDSRAPAMMTGRQSDLFAAAVLTFVVGWGSTSADPARYDADYMWKPAQIDTTPGLHPKAKKPVPRGRQTPPGFATRLSQGRLAGEATVAVGLVKSATQNTPSGEALNPQFVNRSK